MWRCCGSDPEHGAAVSDFGLFPCRVKAMIAHDQALTIRERTMAGMRAAKRRGRHVGRPRKLTAHKLDHARELIADGKDTRAGAAALLGVDAVTLRRRCGGEN
jgi:DNA invertase Pin-like site-specific DNA recombinase